MPTIIQQEVPITLSGRPAILELDVYLADSGRKLSVVYYRIAYRNGGQERQRISVGDELLDDRQYYDILAGIYLRFAEAIKRLRDGESVST